MRETWVNCTTGIHDCLSSGRNFSLLLTKNSLPQPALLRSDLFPNDNASFSSQSKKIKMSKALRQVKSFVHLSMLLQCHRPSKTAHQHSRSRKKVNIDVTTFHSSHTKPHKNTQTTPPSARRTTCRPCCCGRRPKKPPILLRLRMQKTV